LLIKILLKLHKIFSTKDIAIFTLCNQYNSFDFNEVKKIEITSICKLLTIAYFIQTSILIKKKCIR
jgi:hypothetical protein